MQWQLACASVAAATVWLDRQISNDLSLLRALKTERERDKPAPRLPSRRGDQRGRRTNKQARWRATSFVSDHKAGRCRIILASSLIWQRVQINRRVRQLRWPGRPWAATFNCGYQMGVANTTTTTSATHTHSRATAVAIERRKIKLEDRAPSFHLLLF